LKGGSVIEHTRYVLNWRNPRTGDREQRFFERQRDAQERRSELIAAYDRGAYSSSRQTVTIVEAVAAWLDAKRGTVRPITFQTYEFQSRYVVGPLAPRQARRAIIRSGKGAKPKDRPIELLGREKVQDLTTRRIRAWHKLLSEEVSIYCANRAMQLFPFLAGTRPSEQLGLLWDDVDFEANLIRIRRIQLRDGSISEFTKTAASVRLIPMSPLLREMLLAWRVRCPRNDGKLERVFPALGVVRAWPLPRAGGGRPLIYGNFRKRFWSTTLKRLGLPAVTPHSARHSFISTLQAQGVEVGLVAKLAGHKNAVVTLSHYTHAMRGGEDAVEALDRAYAGTAS
jgi:integrase